MARARSFHDPAGSGAPVPSGVGPHLPWMLGVGIAPILFGSVDAGGQAIVGLCLALSLFLVAPQLGAFPFAFAPRWLSRVAWVWLLLPLIPWPLQWLGVLSPAHARLVREFPVEPGEAPAVGWLTVSLAATVQRVWELSLLVAGFVFSRQASRTIRLHRVLPWVLALAVLALVGSDLWYRLHGRQALLGVWRVSWGFGAGTFANPNHYAHWLVVAAMFLVGPLLRAVAPLHSARGSACTAPRRAPLEAALLGGAILAGLAGAASAGSRGAAIAGLGGAFAWGGLLARQSRSRRRWAWAGFGALAVLAVLVVVSDAFFRKMNQGAWGSQSLVGKLGIWAETPRVLAQFPAFGTGWGTFATAFGLFKEGYANVTCWHAENDYLQLLLETGFAGSVVAFFGCACFLRALWRHARSASLSEPEGLYGALAACAAFGAGALVEFVAQIPANALLAAVLLGWAAGVCDGVAGVPAPAPPRAGRALVNVGCALGLGFLSVAQGLGAWHWTRALRPGAPPAERAASIRRSLQWWPWASDRRTGLARQQVLAAGDLPPEERTEWWRGVRHGLNQGLRWDPLNWQLRLERVWLDLAYGTNGPAAVQEAREAVRLNPRQAQIPLRFARHFAARQPAVALEFLRGVDRSVPAQLREALALAWRSTHNPRWLWTLTPATPDGLLTLGDFALEQGLGPLAIEAWSRVGGRLEPAALAQRFLAGGRPDLVVSWFGSAPGTQSLRRVLAQACDRLDQPGEVVRWVEDMVRHSTLPQGGAPGAGEDLEAAALEARALGRPGDVRLAQRLAARLIEEPPGPRRLARVRELAGRFPQDPQLLWRQLQAEKQATRTEAAAKTALRLAFLLDPGS